MATLRALCLCKQLTVAEGTACRDAKRGSIKQYNRATYAPVHSAQTGQNQLVRARCALMTFLHRAWWLDRAWLDLPNQLNHLSSPSASCLCSILRSQP